MGNMNSITIAPDGTSVTMGGGVKAKEVTDALWAADKQTGTSFIFSSFYFLSFFPSKQALS